jgi:hypothetical protein
MKRILALLVCSLIVSYFAFRSIKAQTGQGLTVLAQGLAAPDSNTPDQLIDGHPDSPFFPSIAVKPNNGNIIVAAMLQTTDGPCLTFRSEDGGQTWVDPVSLHDGFFEADAPVVR